MFNKYEITNSSTEYIPYEKTVTINRAPTDESIKLFEEIKEKAYQSILETIKVENNLLNLKAIIYRDSLSYDTYCLYKIKLNSKEFNDKINITNDINKYDKYSVVAQIYKNLSGKLAHMLIESINKNDLKRFV